MMMMMVDCGCESDGIGNSDGVFFKIVTLPKQASPLLLRNRR